MREFILSKYKSEIHIHAMKLTKTNLEIESSGCYSMAVRHDDKFRWQMLWFMIDCLPYSFHTTNPHTRKQEIIASTV